MSSVKSLAKDTAIYGLSSIVGRFLNWLLVPIYTNVFTQSQYGVTTYVYSVVALLIVILTYGMETGYFRFASDERFRGGTIVYSTALSSLAVSSAAFIAIVALFLHPVAEIMKCAEHPSYVMMMAVCVAIDAFTALPFSHLRFKHKAIKFAILKCTGIAVNIGLNLFFLLLCPWLMTKAPGTVSWFYNEDLGIGYIFLSNLIASAIMLPMLRQELTGFRWRFSADVWREMLRYSWPLLVLGVAGIMNQNIATILLPNIVPDPAMRLSITGVYGACFKLAIIMVMFLQAFRFAYEPFIFDRARSQGEDRKEVYATVMKWFVIFAMFVFLAVMVYMPVIQLFIGRSFREGIGVVPIIMMAEFFFGVFFNLSLWYKLTDQTMWGMWFTLLGLVITLAGNFLLVPVIGYYGCAWSSFLCYGTMMTVSYFVGQKKFPIRYRVGHLSLYVAVSVGFYLLLKLAATANIWINMGVGTLLIGVYLIIVLRAEHVTLRQLIPVDAIIKKIRH